MQNVDRWRPSKILFDDRQQRYVPNPAHVALGSRLAVHAMLPTYIEAIQTHTRGRFLDCGCGTTPYFPLYRDRVDEIVCIDWAYSAHRNIHVDYEVDLSGQLPFEAGRFDTVLLADVLEHVKAPAQLIREIARVLTPGGKLILTVPFLYNVHEAPHDYYRFTRYAIADLTERAGLQLVSLEAFGGYPDILCDLLNKGFARIAPLGHGFIAIAGWWSRRGFYQRWRARTRERYPLGYCCVVRK